MTTTYSALQTSIGDFLNRSDLTAIAPTWIALAEADINRRLRHWQMETRTTLTLTSEYVTLPTDWLETVRLDWNSTYGSRRLRLVTPNAIQEQRSYTADPQMFTHEGNKLRIWPVPSSGTGDLLYFAKVPALSDSATTNWLLTSAPDVYLYGALLHSASYLGEDARMGAWGQLYETALASLQRANDEARWTTGMRLT